MNNFLKVIQQINIRSKIPTQLFVSTDHITWCIREIEPTERKRERERERDRKRERQIDRHRERETYFKELAHRKSRLASCRPREELMLQLESGVWRPNSLFRCRTSVFFLLNFPAD